MAGIYVRGKSLWIHFSVSGKQFHKPLKLKNTKPNMRLALLKAEEIEELIENNKLITDSDIQFERTSETKFTEKKPEKTLNEFVAMITPYHNLVLPFTPSIKHVTLFKLAAKKFLEAINKPDIILNEISEEHFQIFRKYMKANLSYNTGRTYTSYMNQIIQHSIRKGYYTTNSNPFIRWKKKEKEYIRTIPDSEMQMIFDYLKQNDLKLYRVIYFLRYSGFRLNEALQLTWKQIYFDKNIIDMENFKGFRTQVFPLNISNGKLKNLLLDFRKDSGKIFEDINPEWVLKPFQKAIQKINELQKKENPEWKEIEKFTVHDLRRTSISEWAKKLMPAELKVLSRHRSIETTMQFYVNMQVDDIADKLNRV